MYRSLRLAALMLLAALLAGPLAAADRHVDIGVRVDAGPFAWLDADTGSYRGYLVDLCTEAVTRAGYTFALHPVTAAGRVAILKGDIAVDGEGGAWTLDLLCDPTTLSLQRLNTLAEAGAEVLTFSQVVFVANGSYVELKARKPRDRPTANGVVCYGAASEQVYLAGYVVGATSETIIERAAKDDPSTGWCLRDFARHDEAVAALCDGEVDLYFGDLDIIEFYRASEAERRGAACDTQPPQRILSYEPYAFLVSNANPGFRPRFVSALYELFSDGTAAQRFASHFAGASKSTALNLLFRINSVPGLRDEVGE